MTRKLDSVSSEDLMAEIGEGDEVAFETLVERHQTSILNFIYRYVGDKTMARDLAQEVFIRVWQAANRYEPKAKFTTWLYRIVTNLCLNELKSSARKKYWRPQENSRQHQIEEEEVSGLSPSAEDLLLKQERIRQISEAVQGLPENQRMALLLKKYENLSYHEIAKIMGCSVSAVESLLVRAKKNLQGKLMPLEK